MRSREKWAILTVLAMLVFAGSAVAADVAKIGVVDFQRLFENSDAGKQIKEQITTQGKKMESELKEKGAEIEEMRKRLEREALVMSKEMREEKERDFRIKVNDIKVLKKKYESELQELQQKLMGGLQKETLSIIEGIGKQEGYLIIMDKRGVLYAPVSIDVTDEVIKQHNAMHAKKGK
jgi:outer membrane protein